MTKLLENIIQQLNDSELTETQCLDLYSQLGYSLGSSISGLKDVGIDELQKMYYEKIHPNMNDEEKRFALGLSLMLQSLLMRTWEK